MTLFKKTTDTVLCVLTFLCFISSVNAQFTDLELGQITDEYKTYTACDFSPGSGAILLKKDGFTFMEIGEYNRNTHYRLHKIIKILSKDGLDAGNIEFTTFGKIASLIANTYNDVGGVWEVTPFDPDNLYKEGIKGNKKLNKYKIPMPNVSEGSIIELLVEIEYKGVLYIPTWYFQEEIPVLSSTYTTHIPYYVHFNPEIKGYYDIETKTNKLDSLFLSPDDFEEKMEAYREEGNKGQFTAKKIPPVILDENYALNSYENISHVEFKSNSPLKISKPKSVSLHLSYNPSIEAILAKKKSNFIEKLNINLNKEDGKEQIARQIYNTIQTKIICNDYNSIYPEKGLVKIIKDGVGNVADINMILVKSLREAGLDSYPLAASTRNDEASGMMRSNSDEYNYLFCLLKIDGENILLDASMENLHFGMLPYHLLNDRGLVIEKSSFNWDRMNLSTDNLIPIQAIAEHEEIYVVNLKIEEDKLKGSIKTKLDHYATYNFHITNDDDKEREKVEKSFKKSISDDWVWGDIEFKDVEPDIPIFVKGNISKEIDVDDLIYIEPALFKIFKENPFKKKERISLVDIPYQIKYKLLFNLEIPEGYALEESPISSQLMIQDNSGDFIYAVEEKNNKVSINITFNLRKITYSVEEYEGLREFFARVHEKLENVIVLKKI